MSVRVTFITTVDGSRGSVRPRDRRDASRKGRRYLRPGRWFSVRGSFRPSPVTRRSLSLMEVPPDRRPIGPRSSSCLRQSYSPGSRGRVGTLSKTRPVKSTPFGIRLRPGPGKLWVTPEAKTSPSGKFLGHVGRRVTRPGGGARSAAGLRGRSVFPPGPRVHPEGRRDLGRHCVTGFTCHLDPGGSGSHLPRRRSCKRGLK